MPRVRSKPSANPTGAQTFRSQYGRKGIRVPVECPTIAITRWLGTIHVSTPHVIVEKFIRETVAKRREQMDTSWGGKQEQDAVRFALWQHEENQAEYGFVTRGGK